MAMSDTAATMLSRMISASLNQSFSRPSSSTYWSEARPTVNKLMPTQSTGPLRRLACGESCRKLVTRKTATIPIGTLMKKHQLQ